MVGELLLELLVRGSNPSGVGLLLGSIVRGWSPIDGELLLELLVRGSNPSGVALLLVTVDRGQSPIARRAASRTLSQGFKPLVGGWGPTRPIRVHRRGLGSHISNQGTP